MNNFNTLQDFKENKNKFEILTPQGFKTFKGLKKTKSSFLLSIETSSGKVLKGSLDHQIKLYRKRKFTKFKDIKVGDRISKEEKVSFISVSSGKYDFFTVQSVDGEEYLIENEFISKNCAFIPSNIFDEFWSSAIPTISSGTETKIIVVSCVTKDTFILDTNRGLSTIEDYIDYTKENKKPYSIEEYSIQGFNDSPSKGITFFNNGLHPTIKLKSKYFELECSENHPLYICSSSGEFDWKKAKDIKIGDYICAKYRNNIFGSNDVLSSSKITLTPDICYSLGLIISEGILPENKEYILLPKDILKELNIKNEDISSEQNKEIPKRLMSISKENYYSLLYGIFDSKHCQIKNSKVFYSSYSEKIINQIRMMLNNLGVLSSKSKDQFGCYTLEIYHCLYPFIVEIGSKLKRKEEEIFSLLQTNKKIKSKEDIIPFSFELFYPFFKRNNIRNCHSIKDKKHLSRLDILLFKELYYETIPELKDFFDKHVHSNLFWDKVKVIKTSSSETFDFSLPDKENDFWCHSVLYNNIVGHQTSNGLNHYYTLWNDAIEKRNGFAPFKVDWWDVPGRDEAWAKEMRAKVKKFDQEFGNEFFGRDTSVIPTELLKTLTYRPPISSNEEMKIFELPLKKRNYLGIVDVAEGLGGDYSVLTIIKLPQKEDEPFEVVFTFRSNTIDVFKFTEVIFTFSKKYNECYLLIEINMMNVAEPLYRDYEVENIIKTTTSHQKMTTTFFSGGSKLGVKTTEIVKKVGLEKLNQLFEEKKLIVNDFTFIEELSTLQKSGKTFKARYGSSDDTSMTLILFAWLLTQEGFKELFGMEEFKTKLNNEYLESIYATLPSFFIEDGLNDNLINSSNEDSINLFR